LGLSHAFPEPHGHPIRYRHRLRLTDAFWYSNAVSQRYSFSDWYAIQHGHAVFYRNAKLNRDTIIYRDAIVHWHPFFDWYTL
jgi:hypothetical protein